MEIIPITLEPQQVQEAKDLARERGVNLSAIVREALAIYLQERGK